MKVKIEKIADNVFDGHHPAGVYVGTVKEGALLEMPTIGNNFWVGASWRTSPVVEIIDETTFKTKNSTYRYAIFADELT
jgi:hypothetical protein